MNGKLKTRPLSENEIIFQDNHLLVVNKRAGLATMGVAEGEPSLSVLAKDYLRQKFGKPGNVYLGIVSRLDARVSGVIVLAKTSKAAARLTQQFKDRKTKKTYLAIVTSSSGSEKIAATGELADMMYKDEPAMRMRCVKDSARGDSARGKPARGKIPKDAKEARLSWTRVGNSNGRYVLEIQLHTGRKHQIRCQLAHAGFPVCGDRKYGSEVSFRGAGIALHSETLEFTHPTLKIVQQFQAPVPEHWNMARYNL